MNALLDSFRRHWLLVTNGAVAVFVALPLLAPVLMAAGRPDLAAPIYAAYHYVCHQWAFRSYFLFGPEVTYGADMLSDLVGTSAMYGLLGSSDLGYKVAFCERDLAIYTTVLALWPCLRSVAREHRRPESVRLRHPDRADGARRLQPVIRLAREYARASRADRLAVRLLQRLVDLSAR